MTHNHYFWQKVILIKNDNSSGLKNFSLNKTAYCKVKLFYFKAICIWVTIKSCWISLQRNNVLCAVKRLLLTQLIHIFLAQIYMYLKPSEIISYTLVINITALWSRIVITSSCCHLFVRSKLMKNLTVQKTTTKVILV